MKTMLKTHISCFKCQAQIEVLSEDVRVLSVTEIEAAASLLGEALDERGWRFRAAEVEMHEGEVRYVAGFWCRRCAANLETYLQTAGF